MPNVLWAGAEASGVPDGVAEDADMDDLLCWPESVKREAQGVLQLVAKTNRRLSPDSPSSIKKTQWVGWTVNTTEWGPIKKWLPEACNADFLQAQETHLPKDALAAEESWMRLQGWRACIAPALFRSPQHGEWASTKQTPRSKGSAGVTVAAVLLHVLVTPHGGAGDRSIELCKGRVLAFYHSGTVPGGVLVLSVYMHTGEGLTQENWQILSTIGQWLISQALPFIIGGDCQLEPKQLEDSGWVRAVGGFVVAPQLATVTPSHWVIDFFVVSRDLAGACEAVTHLSHHVALHRPVRIVVSTRLIQPKQRAMNRPKPWPAERPSGCRMREFHLGWDPLPLRVWAAVGAKAEWTPFIDMHWRRSSSLRFLAGRLIRQARSVAGPKARNWSGRPAKAPGVTRFHVTVVKCSLGAEGHEFSSTLSLLDSDWTNPCWERGTPTTLALWG